MGYLAGGDVLKDMLFVDSKKGLDLSAFDNLAPPVLDIALGGFPHTVLSEDFEILRFDFRQSRFPADPRPLEIKVTRAGLCTGVAQWIELELDEETVYENRPAQSAALGGHWMHILYRFPEALHVAEGDLIRLSARHDRLRISVEFVELVRAEGT